MIDFGSISYSDMAVSLAIIVGAFILSKTIYPVVFGVFFNITSKTRTELDKKIVLSFKNPLGILITMTGIYIALWYLKLPRSYSEVIYKVFISLGILWVLWTSVKTVGVITKWHLKKSTQTLPRTSILTINKLAKAMLYAIALLMVLSAFGVEIGPLMASLGIGGLAVALALQNTLSDFFAGIYISSDKTIGLGDYVKLESGLKGYVDEMGWRSTKIKTLPNNSVSVPNSKLADSVLTNYHQPEQSMAVIVPCGVAYGSNLEEVEKVTIEEGKKILDNTEGGDPDFEPFLRYHEFGESNVKFSVILRVQEYVDQYLVTHEFMKRLSKRYSRENIEISYPSRNIYHRE